MKGCSYPVCSVKLGNMYPVFLRNLNKNPYQGCSRYKFAFCQHFRVPFQADGFIEDEKVFECIGKNEQHRTQLCEFENCHSNQPVIEKKSVQFEGVEVRPVSQGRKVT